MSTRNWREFKWPFERMETFTRSEPFPTNEMKATYLGDKPKKKGAKVYHQALLARLMKKKREEAR